jgi:hypothetical protein
MPRGQARRTTLLIEAAAEILEEIQPATVRAVCYRLFTQGLLTSMKKSETNRVSRALTRARERGEIPWEFIVDETRAPERVPSWDTPEQLVMAARNQYRKDRWARQPEQVEVWSEKGTVRGTLAPVLEQYGVTFRVMHGYASATAVNHVADEAADDDRPFTALYVGDWDPSGLHMSEVDLPGRLLAYGADVEVRRIALATDDVTRGRLPSFLAASKRLDTRYAWYVARYGRQCWELDALSPVVLRDRVADAIAAMIDVDAWERDEHAERAELASLDQVVSAWRATKLGQASEYPDDDEDGEP